MTMAPKASVGKFCHLWPPPHSSQPCTCVTGAISVAKYPLRHSPSFTSPKGFFIPTYIPYLTVIFQSRPGGHPTVAFRKFLVHFKDY